MNFGDTIIGAVVSLLGILITQFFLKSKGKSDNSSSERIAILEHSGEFADKLSKALDEKGALIEKISALTSENQKLKGEKDELVRQLETAQKNIDEMLSQINLLKKQKEEKNGI